MEFRVNSLIHSLSRLPAPEKVGQAHSLMMVESSHLSFYSGKDSTTAAAPIVRVRAKSFGRGANRWLEWVLDI